MFIKFSRYCSSIIEATLCFLRGNPSEFLIFVFLTSHGISYISTENLLLDKACRFSPEFSEDICNAMVVRNRSVYGLNEELKVQKEVSEVQIYITFIKGLLPIICMALLGPWSDRTGRRKPLIVVPIIGHILSHIGLIICTSFPKIPIAFVAFSESVPYSLLGGEYCCLTGIYSYMAVNTKLESRSEGVGKIIAFNIIAIIVGKAAGGFLFKVGGYIGVYLISIMLFLLCILYVFVLLPPEHSEKMEKSDGDSCNFLTGFSFLNEMNSDKKSMAFILILAGTLINISIEGEGSIIYIYTRMKFNWDEIDYSIYNTLMYALQLVGTYITLLLFMKVLKLNDLFVGLIGILSGCLYSLISAFSQDVPGFYTGLAGSIFIGNSILSVRALILKIADQKEVGRMNSLFGICNSLAPLVGGPLFNFVYRNTLYKFPSAFYLITTLIEVKLLLLFSIMWNFMKV